ncbi:MAG: hypothetical protein WCT02_04385, partial [Candidatus Paceibacterota bacterium]
ITVKKVQLELLVPVTDYEVSAGEEVQLDASIETTYEKARSLNWITNKGKISKDGVFQAPMTRTDETATVKVTSAVDRTKTETITVRIKKAPLDLVIPEPTYTVGAGEEVQLIAFMATPDDRAKGLTWSANIGKVNRDGLYQAPLSRTDQSATITVISMADRSKTGTITVNIQKVEMRLVVPQTNYTVKAGDELQIHTWMETKDDRARMLNWSSDVGKVRQDGTFTAPFVTANSTARVIVASHADRTISETIIISIEKAKLAIKTPLVERAAGTEWDFELEYEANGPDTGGKKSAIKALWYIVNHSRLTGNIDINTGHYTTPNVVEGPVPYEVEILGREMNTREEARAKVKLLPVRMIPSSPHTITVHAGDDPVELNFESHNDIGGLDNFTISFSDPQRHYGSLEGRTYLPPIQVTKEEWDTIIATSCLDKAKKSAPIVVKIRLPLCPHGCGNELDTKGKCPVHKQVKPEPLKQGCPNCRSTSWKAGRLCKDCGYPNLQGRYGMSF